MKLLVDADARAARPVPRGGPVAWYLAAVATLVGARALAVFLTS